MKARELRKTLNNTGYTVHETKRKICIGSPLCSDLIYIDKENMKLNYALASRSTNPRGEIRNKELLEIWDILDNLITTGLINDYINGEDTIKKSVKIYKVEDGKLIVKHTEKACYPNITQDGELIYGNMFFTTKEDAFNDYIETHLRDSDYKIESIIENIQGQLKNIEKLKEQNNFIKEAFADMIMCRTAKEQSKSKH